MTEEYIQIKAVGDWELEVLVIPFGGLNDKDRDDQFFSKDTDLYRDHFKTPIVTYYHGWGPDGKPQGDPELIGDVNPDTWRLKQDGWWVNILLDKGKELAGRVWEGAKRGIARASSGSVGHYARVNESTGEIEKWPLAEIALFDAEEGRRPANQFAVALPVMKAVYEQAGITMPDLPETKQPDAEAQSADAEGQTPAVDEIGETEQSTGVIKMEKDELVALLDERDAKKADAEAKAAEAVKAEQARIDEAVAAAEKKLKEELAKAKRLKSDKGDGTYVAKNPELWKYDNLTPEDQAVLVGVLEAAKADGNSRSGATNDAKKALAVKLTENKGSLGEVGRHAMKAAGMKSDEIMQQDLSSYGDEWVGVAYSSALWEAIRAGTFAAANLPSIEVPPGHESIVIPLESGDPTYYKVAEAANEQTSGWPNTTITSSQMGTAKKTLSLSKMGSRVLWSGELEEDSLIPFVSQLRTQLEKAGSEQLEHAIIDGDDATAASTNINDIASTGAQAGTELYLLFDGFRVSPLVTTTANSRSGGVLTAEDFLETLKLMGTAGLNGADPTKVEFIVDPNVAWKATELSEIKTRDVFVRPTMENGLLNGIYGYKVNTSYFMHWKSAVRKANSSGKVDQDSTGNNTTGSILAVRWDQWLLGWRRRMTMETTRIARADTTEIVALARLGLVQRDEEASAISYNITV